MLAPVPTLVELAEDAGAFAPLWPGVDRVVDPRFCLFWGESPSFVQRPRLEGQSLEQAVEDVRALVRAKGRPRALWWVGTTAEPADLGERLAALGLEEKPERMVAAVLDREPGEQPRVPTREVRSLDDYLAALQIEHDVLGVTPRRHEQAFADARERWDDIARSPMRHFLAELDGRPVAMARGSFGEDAVFLMGGATLEEARGRGAYAALVVARWHAGGGRPLAVQAAPSSLPILERLGFRRVGEIRVLVDELRG
jgi:hypothetical protein